MNKNYYIGLFEKFLQKHITAEETEMLILWMKNNDSFQSWMNEKWTESPDEMSVALRQKIFGQIKDEINLKDNESLLLPERKRVSKPLIYNSVRIASLILLILITGLSVFLFTSDRSEASDMIVSVEKGQKANITLPDGTMVAINSDSKLSYGSRFNTKERVITLEGEAYFDIVPDKDRPFIVETPDLSVRALGTSFNVKSYKEENTISTVLMSGKVEVTSGIENLILNPNERIEFDRLTGNMTKSSVESAYDYASWKDNTITFNGETFENIAYMLQRHYNTQIIFESENLKKHRFRGSPANTSLESILQILSLTSPLMYEIRDSVIILKENMEQKIYYEKALK